MLKSVLKIRWSEREKRSPSAEELFIAAQSEWAVISQRHSEITT